MWRLRPRTNQVLKMLISNIINQILLILILISQFSLFLTMKLRLPTQHSIELLLQTY